MYCAYLRFKIYNEFLWWCIVIRNCKQIFRIYIVRIRPLNVRERVLITLIPNRWAQSRPLTHFITEGRKS